MDAENSIDNDVPSPKTPAEAGRTRKDDSFKTCKTTVNMSPNTRRQLRMTPARTSILSGGKPFKEAGSSGRKFNTRRRQPGQKEFNETGGSNETFVMREQELIFDRDSLDSPNIRKISSTPKPTRLSTRPQSQKSPSPLPTGLSIQNQSRKSPSPLPTRLSVRNASRKSSSPMQARLSARLQSKKSPSPVPTRLSARHKSRKSPAKMQPKSSARSQNRKSPIPLPPKFSARPQGRKSPTPLPRVLECNLNTSRMQTINRRRVIKPKLAAWRPPSVMGTASKYMNQCDNRITRARSFKSTAELERDYFNSLRSF